MTTRQLDILAPQNDIQQKPKLSFTVDLSKVHILNQSLRRDIQGSLNRVVTLLVPPKGCSYGCAFCSVANVANPDFPVHDDEGGKESAAKVVAEIAEFASMDNIEIIRIFNNGNILYGTEHERMAEMNEIFWGLLADEFKKHPGLRAIDLEVRVSEFVSKPDENQQKAKEILRQRLLLFHQQLKKIGIKVRCILALEYIESDIIGQQNKFPSALTTSDEKVKNNFLEAAEFLKKIGIPCHVYAMLGGRLKHRTLQSDEVVHSAAKTVLFALQNGAEEAIINSQYLDPINQWEENKDGIPFYVPTERDMIEVLRLIIAQFDQLPKMHGKTPRVHLVPDKEDVIKNTIGPDITEDFRALINHFNNAPDQKTFFETEMVGF